MADAYKLTDGDKALVEALAGVMGTLTSSLVMFPFDTARARVQVRHSDSRAFQRGMGTTRAARAPF